MADGVKEKPELPKPRVALVGYGKWGRNHARILDELGVLTMVIDSNVEHLREAVETYPYILVSDKISSSYAQLKLAPYDAAVVATPAVTHEKVVRELLSNKKHVLCEKPLGLAYEEAKGLERLATDQELVLATGFTFLYDPSIQVAKENLKDLGDLYYVDMTRKSTAVGENVGVIIDTVIHDVSVLLYLLDEMPISVTANARSLGNTKVAAWGRLRFPTTCAHFHATWLAPEKDRQFTVVGEFGSMEWVMGEALSIYDVKGERVDGFALPGFEPLKDQTEDFLTAIQAPYGTHRVQGDSSLAVRVALVIDALNESADKHGASVIL